MHCESTLFTATVALKAGKSDVSLKSGSRIVHSTKCSTLFTATVALIAGKCHVSLKSGSRIVHSTKCTMRAHYSLLLWL